MTTSKYIVLLSCTCYLNINCKVRTHFTFILTANFINFESIIQVISYEANLLGVLLFRDTCVDIIQNNMFQEMMRLFKNLCRVSAHDVFLILKYSLSTTRILHLLRCSPCHKHQIIADIDLLRANICHIANVGLFKSQ